MDLIKEVKLWRGIGHILNTKIGSSIGHAIGQSVNWMASQAVSTDNDDLPWTPFKKPLAQSCLAMVSTAGFYLEDDKPFDVDSARGEAGFHTIPSNFAQEKLKIAHTHYPHARVKEDINVLFPVDRLRELAEAKVIGNPAANFYSFGFGGDLVQEFIGKPDGSAHQLVRKLQADNVDGVLMIPA